MHSVNVPSPISYTSYFQQILAPIGKRSKKKCFKYLAGCVYCGGRWWEIPEKTWHVKLSFNQCGKESILQLIFYDAILKEGWQKIGKSSLTLKDSNRFDGLGKFQGNNMAFKTLLNIYPEYKPIIQAKQSTDSH